MKTKHLVVTALFIAIVCVATMIINVPVPATKGYVNASEVAVFLSAGLLPGFLGLAAAGIGCAMADLILGYTVYAPATLVIKALEAGMAILFMKKFKLPSLAAFVLGSIFMPLGYFLYETVLYGYQTAAVAVLPNLLQGLFGAIVAALIYPALKKPVEKFFS